MSYFNNYLDIFIKATDCRAFEESVFQKVKEGIIKLPVYLSAGQEFIPSVAACLFEKEEPLIFAQHRAHSTYLSFGGNLVALIDELLGKKTGCAYGMGGSASIHSPEINMYGHDGLMGSNVPIAVGACYATKKRTLVFVGDAAVEEDYVLGAIAWAGTKKLPIIFIVEDNNLSIKTPKEIRRNWKIIDVANSFNVYGIESSDTPEELYKNFKRIKDYNVPSLINVNTTRLYWHSGAGIDDQKEIENDYLYKVINENENIRNWYRLHQDVIEEKWKERIMYGSI